MITLNVYSVDNKIVECPSYKHPAVKYSNSIFVTVSWHITNSCFDFFYIIDFYWAIFFLFKKRENISAVCEIFSIFIVTFLQFFIVIFNSYLIYNMSAKNQLCPDDRCYFNSWKPHKHRRQWVESVASLNCYAKRNLKNENKKISLYDLKTSKINARDKFDFGQTKAKNN